MISVLGIRRAAWARLGRAPLAAAVGIALVSCCCLTAPASAQPAQANAVPVLTGDYVLTDVEVCNPNKSGPVEIIALATFNSTTGKLKLVGSVASGDPMTLNALKQTLSYSNSASTVTLGDTVYQAVYGKLSKGTATYLSLIAAADPCAAAITLSRQ